MAEDGPTILPARPKPSKAKPAQQRRHVHGRKPRALTRGVGQVRPLTANWHDLPYPDRPVPPLPLVWSAPLASRRIVELTRWALQERGVLSRSKFVLQQNKIPEACKPWIAALREECGITMLSWEEAGVTRARATGHGYARVRCPRCGQWTGRLVLVSQGYQCWARLNKQACPRPPYRTLELHLGQLAMAFRIGLQGWNLTRERVAIGRLLRSSIPKAKTAADVWLLAVGGQMLSISPKWHGIPRRVGLPDMRLQARGPVWCALRIPFLHAILETLLHQDAYRMRFGQHLTRSGY